MPSSPTDGEPRQAKWIKITAIVPADLFPAWQAAVDEIAKEGVTHPNEPVRNGMVLEILAANYLAGP